MSVPAVDPSRLPQRPQRADARRNYEKLLVAAREAFSEDGGAATLDDIARRSGLGIGTLYRHFPTRQHLLEAVYVDEFQAMSQRASDLDGLEPWDALVQWLRELVLYAATKRALAQEMLSSIDRDAEVFRASREAIHGAGGALLERAQAAGAARADVQFADVARLIYGIASTGSEPDQVERILEIVIDGLRPRP